MKSHGERTQASLEDSWGNVEYEDVDDNYSSGTASVSDSEYGSGDDVPTPLPPKKGKVSPHLSKSQPGLSSQTLWASRLSTPPTRKSPLLNSQFNSPEPSFIMPSMTPSSEGSWVKTSPLRNSQLSKRQPRRSTTPMDSPPRPSPRISRHGHPVQPKKRYSSPTPQKEEYAWLSPHLLFENPIRPIFDYFLSIIGLTLQLLKPVLSYVLLSLLLIALFTREANFLTTSIYSVLSPICLIPGSSYLNLPFCGLLLPQQTGQAEFKELMKVQSVFEDVLHSSIDGASLPLDMKRSEASIRDLKHVVRFSTLPSRNELGVEFQGFVDTARQASSDLTRFNSRIGRAVDQILNINRWTIQILDGISNKEASTGAVPRIISAINPFSSFRAAPRTVHEILFEQYLRHTKAIEEQISSLIMEAQALLGVLDNLDIRLDVIAGIATRDGIVAKGNRDELFEYLWTKLGGNRASVAKLNEQLRLLREVTTYRKTAWKHVSATVLKLQEIAVGLEDLRERVAEPEIVGIREEVPLSFHLENIRMGVERLEGVRGETRRMEGENYRRILDKAMLEEQKLLAEDNARIRTVDAKVK
jgi:hypothetical protein